MNLSLFFRQLCYATLVLPFLHGCVALQHNESLGTLDSFLRDYEAVAFSAEGTSFKSRKLMRWCEPVHLYLAPSIPKKTRQLVQTNIDWLSGIDGLTVVESMNRVNASLKFETPATKADRDRIVDNIFSKSSRLRREMKNANCFFEFRVNKENCIISGSVVVPTYLSPQQQNHCVAEELIQVMGLPNDSSIDSSSIFSADSQVSAASPRDKLMVQIHYQSSLHANMTKDEALMAARPLAATLLQKLDGAAQ